jgi:hypothetical protein
MALQLVAATREGALHHTIRYDDGNWQSYGDTGVREIGAVSCAAVGGELHVVAVRWNGVLLHAIRRGDGSWQSFNEVGPRDITGVSCAAVGSDVHVVVANTGGGLYHNIRRADGSWQGFHDTGVREAATVSCAATGGDLHIAVLRKEGVLCHDIRYANGSWHGGWGNVVQQTTNAPGGFVVAANSVACAGIGGDLHLVVIGADGTIQHTIRRADGSWQGWGNASQVALATGSFGGVACASAGTDLHVAGATWSPADLWHTIRKADTSWLPFGSVNERAGRPGDVLTVGCAVTL